MILGVPDEINGAKHWAFQAVMRDQRSALNAAKLVVVAQNHVVCGAGGRGNGRIDMAGRWIDHHPTFQLRGIDIFVNPWINRKRQGRHHGSHRRPLSLSTSECSRMAS